MRVRDGEACRRAAAHLVGVLSFRVRAGDDIRFCLRQGIGDLFSVIGFIQARPDILPAAVRVQGLHSARDCDRFIPGLSAQCDLHALRTDPVHVIPVLPDLARRHVHEFPHALVYVPRPVFRVVRAASARTDVHADDRLALPVLIVFPGDGRGHPHAGFPRDPVARGVHFLHAELFNGIDAGREPLKDLSEIPVRLIVQGDRFVIAVGAGNMEFQVLAGLPEPALDRGLRINGFVEDQVAVQRHILDGAAVLGQAARVVPQAAGRGAVPIEGVVFVIRGVPDVRFLDHVADLVPAAVLHGHVREMGLPGPLLSFFIHLAVQRDGFQRDVGIQLINGEYDLCVLRDLRVDPVALVQVVGIPALDSHKVDHVALRVEHIVDRDPVHGRFLIDLRVVGGVRGAVHRADAGDHDVFVPGQGHAGAERITVRVHLPHVVAAGAQAGELHHGGTGDRAVHNAHGAHDGVPAFVPEEVVPLLEGKINGHVHVRRVNAAFDFHDLFHLDGVLRPALHGQDQHQRQQQSRQCPKKAFQIMQTFHFSFPLIPVGDDRAVRPGFVFVRYGFSVPCYKI